MPYSGRTAISWTIHGAPLTTASCKSEHIDSMTVQFISEKDRLSGAEFLEVACDLSRYSVAMVPLGPISIYVNAVRTQRQTDCVRYTGSGRGTATDQFPTTPVAIDLKTVATCQ